MPILFTRRHFLKGGLLTAGAVVLPSSRLLGALTDDVAPITFRVVRDDDLLNLEIQFVGFFKRPGQLVPLGMGRSAIVAVFPPQNVAEALFDEVHNFRDYENDPLCVPTPTSSTSSTTTTLSTTSLPVGSTTSTTLPPRPFPAEVGANPIPPIHTYISGPSWIVFDLKNDREPFPLDDVDCWLERLSHYDLRVPRAAVHQPFTPSPPRRDETALEVPFRLFMSPPTDTQFRASRLRPGRRVAELWNAGLFSRHEVLPPPPPPGTTLDTVPEELRPPTRVVLQTWAFYSPDYRRRGEPPFSLYYPANEPLSLHALTRHLLVKQMSEGDGQVDVEHLLLTALGANASFYYNTKKTAEEIIAEQLASDANPSAPDTTLYQWKHRMVVGRDVFFIEAFFGFLLPFAFTAVYVELTQRKFAAVGNRNRGQESIPTDCDGGASDDVGPAGMYLLKRRFIIPLNRTMRFAPSANGVGRGMPLKTVRLITPRSPDLDPPASVNGLFFWPKERTTHERVRWALSWEDESGQTGTTPDAPLFFVSNIKLGSVMYNGLSKPDRDVPVPSHGIAFAPERGPVTELGLLAAATFDARIAASPNAAAALDAATKAVAARFDMLVDGFKTRLTSAPKLVEGVATQVRHAVEQGRDAVLQELNDLAGASADEARRRIAAAVKTWEMARDFPATLETHAIAFTSRVVSETVRFATVAAGIVKRHLDELRTATDDAEAAVKRFLQVTENDLKRDLPDLNAIRDALDKVITQGDFDAAIRGPLAPLQQVVDQLREELKAMPSYAEQARRIKLEVDSQLQDAVRIVDALRELAEKWANQPEKLVAQFTNDADRFIRNTLAVEDSLQTIGSRLVHTQMEDAAVIIPAVKGLVDQVPLRRLALLDNYRRNGFVGLENAAKNGAFGVLDRAIGEAERIGSEIRTGVATPQVLIAGVSREIGAVMGATANVVENVAKQGVGLVEDDVKRALGQTKIFGTLSLEKLIAVVSGKLNDLPEVAIRELPDKIERSWNSVVSLRDQDFGIVTFRSGSNCKLTTAVSASVAVPKPGRPPEAPQITVKGSIAGDKDEAFHLEILQLVRVRFKQVSFDATQDRGSSKQNVNPQINTIDFIGPLAYVQQIADKLGNLGGGFRIDLTPQFVRASFQFAVPPVSFGAFSLRAIVFRAEAALPFVDKPLTFGLGLSTFAKPFELSVMGFAGRGFLAAQFDAAGHRDLEGALEFGGALSFDVGIATGGLHVMAGAYFHITNDTTELTGYVRAGGELDVLGLIRVCAEFFLGVRYITEGFLYGTCEITVSIRLFLLEQDVHIKMEQKIAGSGAAKQAKLNALDAVHLLAAGSAATTEAGAEYPDLESYFTRPHTTCVGRFDRDDWPDQYWSHFDFTGRGTSCR